MTIKKNNNEGTFGGSVGHGNPPKSGQFKKGQSGNPKGRPKKEKDQLCDMVEKVFFSKKPAKINGESALLTVMEMALIKVSESAINGDVSATRLMLKLASDAGFEQAQVGIIPPFVPSRGEIAQIAKEMEEKGEI